MTDSEQNFIRNTHKLPLLLFVWFMTVAVLAAASLSHDWSSWNGFWHRQAILPRTIFSKRSFFQSFDDLCSFLNVILVRGGWIVAVLTLMAVQLVYLRLLIVKRDTCRELRFARGISLNQLIGIELIILLGASIYFLLMTLAFTALSRVTGTCILNEKSVNFPVNPSECVKGEFKGFDISGHCFLIVHSCLLVLEYCVKAWYVWKCPIDNSISGVSGALLKEKDSDLEDQLADANAATEFTGNLLPIIHTPRQYTLPLVAVSLMASVVVLAEVGIFLQTLLFFHTVTEKLLGTLLGSAYWMLLFGLSFKYPHLF